MSDVWFSVFLSRCLDEYSGTVVFKSRINRIKRLIQSNMVENYSEKNLKKSKWTETSVSAVFWVCFFVVTTMCCHNNDA